MVSEELPFLVAEELQMENVLSCCREVTDRGCPFWFKSSYRRLTFVVSEELQTEDALSGFREITDGALYLYVLLFFVII